MAKDLAEFVAQGLAALPRKPDRDQFAEFVSQTLYRLSPATTRSYPIEWVHINGRACVKDLRAALIVVWNIAHIDTNTRRVPPRAQADVSESEDAVAPAHD
jgi:hypothetical protein